MLRVFASITILYAFVYCSSELILKVLVSTSTPSYVNYGWFIAFGLLLLHVPWNELLNETPSKRTEVSYTSLNDFNVDSTPWNKIKENITNAGFVLDDSHLFTNILTFHSSWNLTSLGNVYSMYYTGRKVILSQDSPNRNLPRWWVSKKRSEKEWKRLQRLVQRILEQR